MVGNENERTGSMKRNVYADNAATTQITDSVMKVMLSVYRDNWGNPSSIYKRGREAARLILASREKAANAIGAKHNEIYFTSSGTEADNWAIKSAAQLGRAQGKNHIVTTAVEHHAVIKSCEELENQGYEVTYLCPDEYGYVSAEQVSSAISENTCLVSVMYANNEIGTIMPVTEIAQVCRERGVPFHTDAVQAAGHIPINVHKQGIDMLSLSGHKIHAPKGIGLLYVKTGLMLPSFIVGGAQERGRRAGTENTAGIAAIAQALEDCTADIQARENRLSQLSGRLIAGLLEIPGTRLNGHPTARLSGNVNISFEGIESESLLMLLDMEGIAASGGSACASGSTTPSHVLTAIGLPHDLAKGSLRLTLGDSNTIEDVDYIIETVSHIVNKLRA